MTSPEAPAGRNWTSLAIKALLAVAGSAVTLWWALHDVDFEVVGARLSGSSIPVLVAFVAAQLGLHVLRVWRWGLLVRPLGPVTWRELFSAASLGFPATFFVPLRLGELARPILIARRGVPFGGAMASVVVERIADGVANLGFFFVTLNLMPGRSQIGEELRPFAMAAVVLFGGGLVFLVVTCLAKNLAFDIIRKVSKPIAPNIGERIIGLLDTFVAGAMVLRSPQRLIVFVATTLVFWGVTGLLSWFLAVSYVEGLPVIMGWFATGVGSFVIMIPAGPGFAGTLEAGFKLGLTPFGVGTDDIAVVALSFHALQLLLMSLIAGLGFLTAGGRAVEPVEPSDSDAP